MVEEDGSGEASPDEVRAQAVEAAPEAARSVGWVGSGQAAVLVPKPAACVDRRHKGLVVAALTMRKLNDTRRGLSGPVGAPVLHTRLQDTPLDAPAAPTTNLATPAHRVSVGE